MNFEQEYYEEEGFWEGEMVQDEANRKRIEFTAALIPEGVKSLADIGCGNGAFLNYLLEQKPGLETIGVERSDAALKFVKARKIKGDIAMIPLPDAAAECVTCLEVIEHLPIPVYKKALAELERISSKYLIISVPFDQDLEEWHNQCPSCKTIFNLDLHLRSFTEATMQQLFEGRPVKCIKTALLGESVHYKGHYTFRKLFYKEQFRQWKSPICPICGYNESGFDNGLTKSPSQEAVVTSKVSLKQRLISAISWLPKRIWPKEKKFYWVIGLYEKV